MDSGHNRTFRAPRVAAITVVVATGWVSFEWLFFATKPSFMSLFSLPEKLGVLSSAALVVSACLLLTTLPFAVAGWLLMRLGLHRVAGFAVVFLPVIALVAMAMLVVIDNFSLTLFGWGVRNAAGNTILVHGDYDVDGQSGTALLTRVLRAAGAHVVPFIPNRMRDGYDLGDVLAPAPRRLKLRQITTAVVAASDVDNREPAMPKRDSLVEIEILAVGSSMGQSRGHSRQRFSDAGFKSTC